MKNLVLIIIIFSIISVFATNEINTIPSFAYVTTNNGNKVVIIADLHRSYNTSIGKPIKDVNLETLRLIEKMIKNDDEEIIIGLENRIYPEKVSLEKVYQILNETRITIIQNGETVDPRHGTSKPIYIKDIPLMTQEELIDKFWSASLTAKILYPQKIKIIGYEDSLALKKANQAVQKLLGDKKTEKDYQNLLANRGYWGIKNFLQYIEEVNRDGIFIMGCAHNEEIMKYLTEKDNEVKNISLFLKSKNFWKEFGNHKSYNSEEKKLAKEYQKNLFQTAKKIRRKNKNEDRIIFIEP